MLTEKAIKIINGYRTNKIIMNFVEKEAREKVASEIRVKCKGGTTEKAVSLMCCNRPNIRKRVNDYVNAGLVGCYMASFQNN